VRECDAVVRWGGEEFLLVLPGAPIDNAFAVAERARSRVAQEPFGDGSTLHVTLSAGVAERGPNEAVDDLIRRADQALYLAKRGGRDQTRRA
jgi:diguanylate cyclase (GGDEF)-like protein